VAEARALRDGVRLVVQAEFNNINIEGDNLMVTQALKGDIQVPRQISNIIEDAQAWLKQEIQANFNHIFQEANMAANWLSKFGHSISGFFSSDCCFSPNLPQMILDE